jgi:hypothetical protein
MRTSFVGDNATLNTLTVSTSAVLSYVSNSIIGVGADGTIQSLPLTDGQLLIGRTGTTPLAATLTGTVNRVSVTSASGVITLSTPQDIHTTADVIFGSLNLQPLATSSTLTLTTIGGGSTVRHADGVGFQITDTISGKYIRIGATIATNHNTLDNGAGTMTVKQLIDSGLTASTMVSCSSTKQLQSTTLAATNGMSLALAGSTLTSTLLTTATPTIAGLTVSGLTATTMLSASATKGLQSTTIANSNGCNASFAGSALTFSMTQDLSVGSNPSFGAPYFTGMIKGGVVVTDLISGQAGSLAPANDVLMPHWISMTPYTVWGTGTLAAGSSLTKTRIIMFQASRSTLSRIFAPQRRPHLPVSKLLTISTRLKL